MNTESQHSRRHRQDAERDVVRMNEMLTREIIEERNRAEHWYNEATKLEEKLTAERQRREHDYGLLEVKLHDANTSLLSALAAIEKKDAKLMELIQFHISGDPCHVLETVALQPDLSLLHEHDAQLLKEHGL